MVEEIPEKRRETKEGEKLSRDDRIGSSLDEQRQGRHPVVWRRPSGSPAKKQPIGEEETIPQIPCSGIEKEQKTEKEKQYMENKATTGQTKITWKTSRPPPLEKRSLQVKARAGLKEKAEGTERQRWGSAEESNGRD